MSKWGRGEGLTGKWKGPGGTFRTERRRQSLPAEKVPRPGLRLAICFTCPETASIGDPWGPGEAVVSQRRGGRLETTIGPWTKGDSLPILHLLWKPLRPVSISRPLFTLPCISIPLPGLL